MVESWSALGLKMWSTPKGRNFYVCFLDCTTGMDYFFGHKHSTSYGGSISQLPEISVIIIQGSVIGPVSYVVSASDLSTVTPGNFMF